MNSVGNNIKENEMEIGTFHQLNMTELYIPNYFLSMKVKEELVSTFN